MMDRLLKKSKEHFTLLAFTILLGLACSTGAFAQTPTHEFLFTDGTLADNTGSGTFMSVVHSGTDNHMTLMADRAGNIGNALLMNGDYMGFPNTLSQSFSVSFYMKTTDNPTNPKILISDRGGSNFTGRGYTLMLRQGKLNFYAEMEVTTQFVGSGTYNVAPITVSQTNGAYTVNDGNWHHIVLVANAYQNVSGTTGQGNAGYSFQIYVDGNADTQPQLNYAYTASSETYIDHQVASGTFYVAGYTDAAYKYTDGVDDIKYYTQALTQAEVTALFNTALNGEVTVANPLPDFTVEPGFVETIGLSSTFSDANGDALTYSVSSSNEAAVGAAMVDATTFYIYDNEIENYGPATITVTATDGNGSTVTDEFVVTLAQCVVAIPDANFKTYLVGNTAINTNNDSEIQCDEAAAFTGTIEAAGLGISDLTGIEAFTGITGLVCNDNSLTTLDLSQNTALQVVNCYSNSLTSLNVSACSSLATLMTYYNNLSTLDLSGNPNLQTLYSGGNQLTSLDLSHNPSLVHLLTGMNPLGSIDVSTNTSLQTLEVYSCNLSTLDVNTLSQLQALRCEGNSLTALDLSNNANLQTLQCHVNQLTSLDVSSNGALISLNCNSNALSSLNIANGNNTNFTTLNASNNTSLTCVQVDEVDVAAGWTGNGNFTIPDGATYSEDCSTAATCAITNVTVDNISACDEQTNGYSVDLTITYENAPAGGFLSIYTQSFTITGSPQTVTLSSLPADGNDITTSVYFTDESTCAQNVSWTAPVSCSPPPCDITNVDILGTECDGTDAYSAAIVVYYTNAPSSGTINVSADGINGQFDITGSPQNITLTGLPVGNDLNGYPVDLYVYFSENGTCDLIFGEAWWTPGMNDCAAENTAPVLAAIGNQSIEVGTPLTFTATATDAEGDALTFSLDAISTGKGMSLEETLGIFTWTPANGQIGTHEVTITASDGTLEASEEITITVSEVSPVLGIGNLNNRDIKVYPNPVVNELRIESDYNKAVLYNHLGKQVGRWNGNNKLLDVSGLEAGIYILILSTDNGTFSQKIVKE